MIVNRSLDILNKVRTGELTTQEANQRLEALELEPDSTGSPENAPTGIPLETRVAEATSMPADQPEVEDIQSEIGWWKSAWLIPFGIGTGIFVIGAILMGWAYSSQHLFWFYCAWLPVLFGMLALFLGWWSHQARWLHVRIQGADGGRVSVSLPIPLRMASLGLRLFGRFIPKIKEQNLTDLPLVLDSLGDSEGPITVEVNDDDGGRVRVYIL